jgi:hypothetical protein
MANNLVIKDAPLPAVYENAKNALATCEKVDECKEWADKAAALRSYAKQAEDTTLMNHAQRIQARAIRRAGELIEQIEPSKGGRPSETTVAAHSSLTRRQVAEDAGLSEFQQYTAQRVARVPEQDFEAQVESDTPPTITALAEQGKTAHVRHNSGENEWYTPPNFIASARKVMGGIDCDPATCEKANETVQAETTFTIEDSGLDHEWYGRVWMNPPYAQPLIREFSEKLVNQLSNIDQACVLVNNATETAWGQLLLDACNAACFVRGRVRFLDPQGRPGAPLQGQMILYYGDKASDFAVEFSEHGTVLKR